MNKDNKNGRSKINGTLIKESLMNYNDLAQQLKENVADSVKAMLDEEVRKAYAAIMNESDDKEDDGYEVEEVDDTETQEAVEPEDTTAEEEDATDEVATEQGTEPEATEDTEEVLNDEDAEGETEGEADFEEYRIGDNEYDLTGAKDEDIVKIYKKLTDDDQVTVVKDGDRVKVSDRETGADYIIELGEDEPSSELSTEDDMDMNESVIYEIALNEYDSHVGYTDNYQKKDVMTTDGVKEPGKYRDIDKGVPHTAEKPWSKKKDGAPFNHQKGKTVECGTQTSTEPELEETVAQKGGANRAPGIKSHIPDTSCTNNPRKHRASVAGEYQSGNGATNEAIAKKANKILEDYKKVKEQLGKVTEMLKEAAVTNVNLGGIIKLISENATTKEEKRDIINRFTNEVRTIEESRSLYNTISAELNKKPQATANINEEQQFGGNNEVISESKLYQDESLMNSLGLMHKICK